jgi:hypothetical protein
MNRLSAFVFLAFIMLTLSSYVSVSDNGSVIMPTSGVYWTTFSNIPDSTYELGGEVFGKNCYLSSASICEPSTGQVLADLLDFPEGVNCMTTKDYDGVQYWLERTQDSNGKTVSIKVAMTTANIPYLNLKLKGHKSQLPELFISGLKADGNVVHTPDGRVLSNPYEDTQLKFAGSKLLIFKAEKLEKGIKARRLIESRGYECSDMTYRDKQYSFYVTNTITGRAKIEKDVLEKHYWFPVKEGTYGNRGLYELCDTIKLNIISHSQGELLRTQKIKLEGAISSLANDFDPVTNIQVVNTNGTETKRVDANITSDSTFTADVELFPGLNLFTFIPMHNNSEGKEVYNTKYVVNVKNEKIDAFRLIYEAGGGSKIVITRKIKTIFSEPDSSITEEITQISANLKIDLTSSKLWYIKKSPENARSCSEYDNCWIFSGISEGKVTVSEKFTKLAKNCDGEFPLTTVSKSTGMGALDKYRVFISATLTPYEEELNSELRNYQLCISAGPEFVIHSSPDWPTSQSSYYDCTYKKWIPSSNKIAPIINIRKENPLLRFSNSKELEDFTESPNSSKSWNFSANEVYDDGYSVTTTQYEVTLTINP